MAGMVSCAWGLPAPVVRGGAVLGVGCSTLCFFAACGTGLWLSCFLIVRHTNLMPRGTAQEPLLENEVRLHSCIRQTRAA